MLVDLLSEGYAGRPTGSTVSEGYAAVQPVRGMLADLLAVRYVVFSGRPTGPVKVRSAYVLKMETRRVVELYIL